MTEFFRHVLVCRRCGKGFLRHPGTTRDPFPVWEMLTGEQGESCYGEIDTITLPSGTVARAHED